MAAPSQFRSPWQEIVYHAHTSLGMVHVDIRTFLHLYGQIKREYVLDQGRRGVAMVMQVRNPFRSREIIKGPDLVRNRNGLMVAGLYICV